MTQPTLLACASCCPDEDLCQMPLRSPSDWPMRAWHRAPQPSMWHNPVRNTVRVPHKELVTQSNPWTTSWHWRSVPYAIRPSRKDPHKLAIMFFSFKSLYHPGMGLGTTRDHSRALGAPGGHYKCISVACFGPGRAIIRSRAAKTLDSNSDTTALRPLFVSSEYG